MDKKILYNSIYPTIVKLRKGEKVPCPNCDEGVIVSDYPVETTMHFHCDKCDFMINMS